MSELDERILRHADVPYNPQKAHEYYLRTRKLKGHQPSGSSESSKGGHAPAKKSGAQNAQRHPPKKTPPNRQALQAQVVVIKRRLTDLQSTLKDLLAEQQDNAQKKADKKHERASGSSKSGGDRHLTAQQKSEARQRSKDYYKEHKKPKADDKTVEEKIQYVRSQIRKIKDQLAAAQSKLKTQR